MEAIAKKVMRQPLLEDNNELKAKLKMKQNDYMVLQASTTHLKKR